MDAASVFRVANIAAMLGWVLMALLPRWRGTELVVHRGVLPLLLSVLYLGLFVVQSVTGGAEGGFGSLAGVKQLFSNDWVLLAGWVHYLAFDMFVGSWVLQDSWRRGISHWLMLPILFFTFMLGPIGFLAYRGLALFYEEKSEEQFTGSAA